jgi:apolipoprotein N-acyltransferase
LSQFEFIFVLISIIAGLALAQFLSGMTRPPRDSTGRIDIAHVAFSAGVTVLLITVWWSTFRWQSYETWTVVEFLLLCFYVSLFYVKAVILSPLRTADLPAFEQIRGKFYAVRSTADPLRPLINLYLDYV